jgi:RNA polymerase II-associated protein 1
MGERGSLCARAIQVIWECIGGLDGEVADIEGVELQVGNTTDPGADAISLPFEFLLGQITKSLAAAALPLESLFQLLETSTAHQCHCMHDHKYT